MRQLQILLIKINKRRHNDFAKNANLQAALRGIQFEIPLIGVTEKTELSSVSFNKEQEEYADQALHEMMQRKMAEYG